MSTISVIVKKDNISLECRKGGFMGLIRNQQRLQKVEDFSNELQKIFKLKDHGSLSGNRIQNWGVEGFTKEAINKITGNLNWSHGKGNPVCGEEAILFIVKKLAEKAGFNFVGKDPKLMASYQSCLESCLE